MTDYIPNATFQDFTSETQSENSVPPSHRSVENQNRRHQQKRR